MLMKIRDTLCKSYERSALTYGAECWALRVYDERKLKATEIRMLLMICGKTLKENNEKIHEMKDVKILEEFWKSFLENKFAMVGTCGVN